MLPQKLKANFFYTHRIFDRDGGGTTRPLSRVGTVEELCGDLVFLCTPIPRKGSGSNTTRLRIFNLLPDAFRSMTHLILYLCP